MNPTAQLLQPMSSNHIQTSDKHVNQQVKSQNLGATWSNSGSLNIDLDNLLSSNKNDKGIAPSMNQLASNPTSPINQPRLVAQTSLGNPSFGNINAQNFAAFNQSNNQFFANLK